jgi:hypothetical protein
MANEKATLYDLTGEWLELYDMADDPEMDADMWFDTIEGLEGEIEDKADGYAKVIAQLNADAAAIKAEEERLYGRRKTIENRVASMKSRLQQMMELTGKTKFKTTLYSFGIQKNPASVVIDDESKVPAEFWIAQDPKLNKSAIKELLSTGEICEYAHLEQGQSLRIR